MSSFVPTAAADRSRRRGRQERPRRFASLRTLAALPGSLLELVDRVNRYSSEHSLQGRRFTTAFFAELEPATGALTYVNAGHNWPILRRASGVNERLETGGLPLGITTARAYQAGSANLASGDLLLIFTDGVVEAENADALEYGEERLLRYQWCRRSVKPQPTKRSSA